jgi:hypothetical protein
MTPATLAPTAAGPIKAVSLAFVAIGIVTALAAVPALDWPMRLLFDIAFWPLDGRETFAARETRLALAIGGGLTAGFGAMIYAVAEKVLPRDAAAARAVILTGAFTWFTIDSCASMLAGAPVNVLLNVGFLLAILWPTWQIPAGGPSA